MNDITHKNDYMDNTNVDIETGGIVATAAPFVSNTSSQRLTMLSNHLNQYVIVQGNELPIVMTGYELIYGDYTHNPTARESDAQMIAGVNRFQINHGIDAIKVCPYSTIIYKDVNDVVSYFDVSNYTYRSSGYGYTNRKINVERLYKGNMIPKDMRFTTSPAQHGVRYNMGVNLNVAYLTIPQITEDAFVISESAARKLGSEGVDKITINIKPDQIPVFIYSMENNDFKFFPDIGEKVRDDGIICALRSTSDISAPSDLYIENLTKLQEIFDDIYYAKPGAEIVDVMVTVNRKVKFRNKPDIFQQLKKYRDNINNYNENIIQIYNSLKGVGVKFSSEFNTLVTNCMESLYLDGAKPLIIGGKKQDLIAVKNKEPIEFIQLTLTYKYAQPVSRGFKLTDRCGGKGTVSAIWPDEDMPVDDFGIRADLIKAPISVFNRMNPAQWYEQVLGRAQALIRQRIIESINADSSMDNYIKQFDMVIDFLKDCNIKWGTLVAESHPTAKAKQSLIQDIIKDNIYIQISPFMENTNPDWVLSLCKKWNVTKTLVTYRVPDMHGGKLTIRSRSPVTIGPEYIYLLYKMPHSRCTALSHVNQFQSPVRASQAAKLEYPVTQTSIRIGEDEIRNIIMTSGAETAAFLLGGYANNIEVTGNIAKHLLYDPVPSQLENVDMDLATTIQNNRVVGLAKHLFATAGIVITPDPATVNRVLTAINQEVK